MSSIKKYDSVDCILDKIDAELSLLKPLELPAFFKTPAKGDSAAAKSVTPSNSSAPANAGGSHVSSLQNGINKSSSSVFGQGTSNKDGLHCNSMNGEASEKGIEHTRARDRLVNVETDSVVSVCTEDFENAFDDAQLMSSSDVALKRGSALEPVPDSDATQSEFSLTDLASSDEGDVESLIDIGDLQNEQTLLETAMDDVNSTRTEEGYDTERELKDELTKESGRIQREIQMERAARGNSALPHLPSSSPARLDCSSRITEEPEQEEAEEDDNYEERACDMDIAKSILEETINSIREAKQEKLLLLLEVNNLQDSVEELEGTLEQLEKLTLDNRARAEEARSQLTLAECQKDTLLKDLEKLNAELQVKHDAMNKSPHRKRIFNGDNCNGDSSTSCEQAQLSELLEEKNQLIAALEQQCRSIQRERDELEKCVALVNDDLISERKKSRMRVDNAEDEMENLLHKLDESNSALEEMGSRLRAAESKMQQLQEEKIQCMLEKTRECEELKGQSQRDLLEVKAYHATEIAGMAAQRKLDEDKITRLQEELARKEHAAADARSQMLALQQALAEKDKEKDAIAKDMVQKLDTAAKEKAAEIRNVREAAERDQLQLKRMHQAQLCAETESLLQKVKREHADQVALLQQSIAGKDDEIMLLKESLKSQDESAQRNLASVQADSKQKRDEAVRRERELWEQERQYLGQQQMAHYKEELCKHMEKLKEQYESERSLVQQLQQKNRALAAELDDLRQANVRMGQDYQRKLTSASKSKKAVQKEFSRDLEAAKAEWEEDKLVEMKRLTEALEEKDSVIQSLESAQKSLVQRESELESLLDKCEYTVVQEINEECRKTALVLGVAPRKASSLGPRSSSSSPSGKRLLGRSNVITSALANLRACNEELRSNVKELNSAGDAAKAQLQELQQKQSTEIEKLKTRLQREKLKEQLAKDEAKRENGVHQNGVDSSALHRGHGGWDDALYDPDVPEPVIPERTIPEDYSDQLTKQLRMCFKRQEKPESRSSSLRRQHARPSSPAKATRAAANGFEEPLTTVAMLRKLQEHVKYVCSDTGAQSCVGEGSSSSSLSDPSSLSELPNGGYIAGAQQGIAEEYTRSLEQRIKAAELQAQQADRSRRCQLLLGQKLYRKDLGDLGSSQSRPTRLSSLSLSNL